MTELKAESGFQLMSRFNDRPSLLHLDDVLFPEGPNPGDVVQISGESGVGKSLLLSKFLIKCLLPKNYNGVDLGGLETSAILIDTGAGISILKLVCLMEKFISAIYRKQSHKEEYKPLGNTLVTENIIKNSLKNLVLLKTYNPEQLEMNSYAIEKILTTDTKMSVIIIDSLTSYYWSEVTNLNSIKNMDLYLKSKIQLFSKYSEEYENIVIFSTEGMGFEHLKKKNSSCGYSNKFEELSAEIKSAYPEVQINSKKGSPGSFEVIINGELVHSKLRTLAFPDFKNVLDVIKEVESGMPPRKIEKHQSITDCIIL